MLDNYAITEALAATLKLIPDLAAAMTVLDATQTPVVRIFPFHYLLGEENQLARAVYEMPAPSMVLAWDGDVGGNFDGATITKHRFILYYRMGNAAGLESPVGYERLWWLTCNQPPAGSTRNIREITLYDGLDIMDHPTVSHAVDEDGVDRFVANLALPEIGDQ